MNSTQIACILSKDNRRSYANTQVCVSITHEVETTDVYAGMDCCCNAGSIAISDDPPLSSDIGMGNKFSIAYDT